MNPKKIKQQDQQDISPYTAMGSENVPGSSMDGVKVEQNDTWKTQKKLKRTSDSKMTSRLKFLRPILNLIR